MNVGGWQFTTSLGTLCSEQGSVLEKMFSGKFNLKMERDGSIFIDRSGEHFNYILNFLRGDICGISDISFDENTRKSLIKEAEYYQLDRMKDILAFKSSTLAPADDQKDEVINIIEKVIHNKKALKDILKDSHSSRRRMKEMNVKDLCCIYDTSGGYMKWNTAKKMRFEDAHWDHLKFENVWFLHDTSFKNCSFLGTTFGGCVFRGNIDFHNCDLIFTDFRSTVFDNSSYKRVVDFDGSDLRGANFKETKGIACGIRDGSVKITDAKYINKAEFDDDAMRAIIGRVETFM